MYIQRRKVYADDTIDENMDNIQDAPESDEDVVVEPEATDLLFESEDVAELVAEVTGQPVEVTVDDDSITFAVGEDEYTVEPEGDEELLEAATRIPRKARKVAASTRRNTATRKVAASRTVPASRKTRTVRRTSGRR